MSSSFRRPLFVEFPCTLVPRWCTLPFNTRCSCTQSRSHKRININHSPHSTTPKPLPSICVSVWCDESRVFWLLSWLFAYFLPHIFFLAVCFIKFASLPLTFYRVELWQYIAILIHPHTKQNIQKTHPRTYTQTHLLSQRSFTSSVRDYGVVLFYPMT